ncbi:hypothetical protein [Rhodoferax sp. UBA5149]|uniref:hypothetical protein n=1 Tax=Rhodoferax sp. UBA5149 TaxID=1947379 RepID=UPI0025EF730B|nr:hypothetical protein [Rhodoferax sp. UBA5149]
MQSQQEQRTPNIEMASGAVSRASLHAEANFKRLMRVQGWWVDTTRFDCDPSYATELIRFATASQSFALRECAIVLQTALDGPAPCNTGRVASYGLL